MSETLMNCRKRRDVIETKLQSLAWDRVWGGDLFTAQMVAGRKAARAWSRLSCGTWEPGAAMPRERLKGKHLKSQSTKAERRVGSTRSSDEVW